MDRKINRKSFAFHKDEKD